MERELEKLRDKIDHIDKEILELIMKRVECVEKVGELKGKNNFRIYVPERENSIFKKLYCKAQSQYGENKISLGEIETIFTEIISFCRARERKVRIEIEDYNCFFIAKKIFGECIDIVYKFQEISKKEIDFKILKLEENRYSEIFSEEIFKYIVSFIDFSGERYIILGREKNGKGIDSFTGIMIYDTKNKSFEFREYSGFLEDKEVESEIGIKILGSYEKRKIEGIKFKGDR